MAVTAEIAPRVSAGIAARCARATIGHAAALPSPAMNSRRRICHLPG